MITGPVTVKVPELWIVPPGVVTLILPLVALVGTVAVILSSVFTVKEVALPDPNLTIVAPVK